MNLTVEQQEAVAGRIRFLMKRQGLSQAEFARRLGIDAANLSKHLNGRLPVTSGLINRISADMGVSKRWLATGEDLPFARPVHAASMEIEPEAVEESVQAWPEAGIPIYDIDVTAGTLELSRQFTADRIIGSMNLPSVSRDSVIVRVNGDSMMPEIFDGSYVAIRRVADPTCIFWGQIYVVVLEDYRLVKHVHRHADRDMVILRSANTRYDDMEVRLDRILGLYLVEAILNIKIQC